jgi:hypothetical protein
VANLEEEVSDDRLRAHALALFVLSSIAAGGRNLTVSLTAEDDLLVVGDEHNNGAWFDRESGYLSLRNSGGTINWGPSSYAVHGVLRATDRRAGSRERLVRDHADVR